MNGVGFAFRLISGEKKKPPFSHTQGNGNGKGSSSSSPFMHLEREEEVEAPPEVEQDSTNVSFKVFSVHMVCSDTVQKRKKYQVFSNLFVESRTSSTPSPLFETKGGERERRRAPSTFAVKANAQKRERKVCGRKEGHSTVVHCKV